MRWWPLVVVVGCQTPSPDEDDVPVGDDVPFVLDEVPLTGFVDPMLGTDGPGNVIPGALVPHGMVRASPDTTSPGGSIDAYEYGDGAIEGFTHTHLEGPGGSLNGYSHLLVLPQVGELVADRQARPVSFDHADEVARPGYYGVTLGNGVQVELTATGHAAVHRYRFPAGPARLLFDVGHSNGLSVDGSLSLDGAVVEGFGQYNVHLIAALATQNDGRTAFTKVYLHAELSVPPTDRGTMSGRAPVATAPGASSVTGAWSGGWVGWDFAEPTVVEVRLGVSLIDTAQAERNLTEEVGEASLEQVVEAADAAWNHVLNRVQIEASEPDRRRFYTALYRSFFQPADYTEAGGRFAIGSSGTHVVRQAEGFHYVTDDWCMWDTFRTSHPLKTLVEPEWPEDIITSMLTVYEEGGWLPKCSWNATGYSRVMIGNHAVPILADAAVKGLDRFDTELAWEAVDHAGTADIPLVDGICGYYNLGTPPDYLTLGYVPSECDPGQSASMTIEHAYDDWASARFAEVLGRTEDAARYDARGGNWRNVWDDASGFARGRLRDGTWRTPFDPAEWGDFNDFTEATSWIYSFHMLHDVPGMVDAMGGQGAFVARLDQFFDDGLYDPSNQPSYHVPWLYAAAGRPSKTQARVREIMDTHFGTGVDGLPGNDDAGSTSAWLVFAMLGLYPLAPGDPRYVLSTPRVQSATLHLHPGFYPGGEVELKVIGDPETEPYVQSVTWNGEPVTVPWMEHAALVKGGVLEVTVGAEASAWGE